MFSHGFRIVDKQRFELFVEDVQLNKEEAVVEITNAAICKADLRYYEGLRDEKTLGLKYPISLIHEAVGVVVKDPSGRLHPGQKVALCPNILISQDRLSDKVSFKKHLGENYSPLALFASSSIDGFSRNLFSYPMENLIPLPSAVKNEVAVFCELISVCLSILRRTDFSKTDTVAIWGDGILGYILAQVLSTYHAGKIIIVGSHKEKMDMFDVHSSYLHYENTINEDIDVAIECIGGNKAEQGINQMIDSILPGGKIILTGVSENTVSIATRKILEKGISLYGVTRSNVEDFVNAAQLLSDNLFCEKLERLVLGRFTIDNINDYYIAFEKERKNNKLGKYILEYNF
ncbi:zinc-binding dehydrogenase [Paenibacillus sp. MABNR03]|uniref:zinc-binding dehydrogenase n=1 Tax=Paenibacillus sp. MABNR03 TaxID=3142626 RepID=UPI003D2D15C1